jgi:hypothetical protein
MWESHLCHGHGGKHPLLSHLSFGEAISCVWRFGVQGLPPSVLSDDCLGSGRKRMQAMHLWDWLAISVSTKVCLGNRMNESPGKGTSWEDGKLGREESGWTHPAQCLEAVCQAQGTTAWSSD